MMELKRVLAKFAHQMGYSEIWPKQEEVILDLVHGSNMFISLPTGSSKVPLLQSAASGRRGVPPAWLFHRNHGKPSGHTSSKHIGMCRDVA